MGEQLILTDGGLETTLVFGEGLDLAHFAAFPLLDSAGVARSCAATSRRSSPLPASTARPSSSTRRPGGPIATGVGGWAMTRPSWTA